MKNILRLLRREFLQITLLVLPFALAAAWWNRLPATVVSHWDIHNQPNGWMPKAPALLLLPVLNIGLCGLFAVLPRIDPRLRRNPDAANPRQRRLWQMFRLASSAQLTVLALVIIVAAAGWRVDIGRVCCSSLLVLLAVMGNFFGNIEPNYLMGIRTPWTLEDPATWRSTHRLGSRVMVFGSVALLVIGFFVPGVVQFGLLIGFAVVLAVGSVGYSAWFYQTHASAVK